MAASGEDPSSPVEGVTLERYADLTVALFDKSEAEQPAIAQAHGVPPERLKAVIDGWTSRMSDPQTLFRYNELYQKAMVAAGVQRPDLSLEQYAEMMKEVTGGTPVDQVCANHGMTMQQWALVNQHIGQQMMADPSLATKYAKLMGFMP